VGPEALLDLRADRDPFDKLPQGIFEITVELMTAVIPDMLTKQTGTDSYPDSVFIHWTFNHNSTAEPKKIQIPQPS
jgi:hypothetical protein